MCVVCCGRVFGGEIICLGFSQAMLLFDIGANKGEYAHSNRAKYSRIVCVEPLPAIAESLRQRFQHDHGVFVEEAMVSFDDEHTFYESPCDTVSTASDVWRNDSRFSNQVEWAPLSVPRTTIDALVQKHGTPDFIKLDVEGYEYWALQTMTERYCPIAFEWAEECKEEIALAMQYLEKLGYTKYAVQHEDAFTWAPSAADYQEIQQVHAFLDMLDAKAKSQWGMLWIE